MYLQRYIVIEKDGVVFTTEWFDSENHWSDDYLTVFDTHTLRQFDGESWTKVKEDHL